jgi:PHD/YefM family antitoxin component YafN of YafNO toxin-antitoxin module
VIKSKETTIHRLPLTKARVNLGQVVRRAHVNKEYFILEKDGIPVVGILDAEELEDYLELRNPDVREHIRRSHAEFLAGKSRPAEDLLTELTRFTKPKKPIRARKK